MPCMNWLAVVLFFVAAGDKPDNPWEQRVDAAVERARLSRSIEAYRTALDAAWRADDWRVAATLADEARELHPRAPELFGPAARAYWRAGRIRDAEAVASDISLHFRDPIALQVVLTISMARGDHGAAKQAAARLESLDPETSADLQYLVGYKLVSNQLAGLPELIRRAHKRIDPSNGYPEIYLEDQLAGLAEFLEQIGPEPINRLQTPGAAPMPVISMVNLPGCEVMINGHGPYRMVVDTGGSLTFSLEEEVAREIGLDTMPGASVHGVSGKQASGQALVDELRVGDIVCRRVLTRTFPVRKAVAYMADGIIGTGIFHEGRLTLDFAEGQLRVERSSALPGPGDSFDLRITNDSKLIAPVVLNNAPAAALIDSGADAFAVAPSRLRSLFPDRDFTTISALAMGVGGQQGPVISLTPGVNFELAGRRYENYGGLGLDVLDTLLGPLLGIQTDVLIGMPVLRDMKTLTIDFPRCTGWIDWLEREPEAKP